MEKRSETVRESRRRDGEDTTSHVDRDTRSRGDDSAAETDEKAGDFTQLRERGDRKGGSTSGNG